MRSRLIPTARQSFFIPCLMVSLLLFLPLAPRAATTFPVYSSIKSNVVFWEKVYTQYSTHQGIIHDTDRLDIIYEVIPLFDPEGYASRRKNKKRIKAVKKKYKKILLALTHNKPKTKAEKRVFALYGGSSAQKRTFKTAAYNIRCQVGQADRFQKGLRRSGRYINQIKDIFAAHGLPVELAYLPHVESSFNYKAYSRFGAAGIWQFTRSTGKRFMTINYTVDERRDPIIATHAAAKYLKENYTVLGNWPLALTAYNHGTSGMRRAKKKYKTYDRIFRFYKGRRFRFASRNFYSEFLAASKIAQNPGVYFNTLKMFPVLKYHTIKLAGYVSLDDLCRHYGVTPAEIRNLNPALRNPVFTGQKYLPKGYAVRLPDRIAKAFAIAGVPKKYVKGKQKPSRFVRVRRGDTAGRIAKIHGVSLKDLIAANNLNHRATIYQGQNLRIPLPGERPEPIQRALASEEPAVKEPTIPSIKPLAKPALQKPKPREVLEEPAVTPESVNPTIVTGDLLIKKVITEKGKKIGIIGMEVEETIGHYADWLGVSASAIRHLNKLAFGRIVRFNQTIKIPLDKVSKEEFEEKRYEFHKEMDEDFFSSYKIETIKAYTIQKGDNLWDLCYEKFEVPFWLMKKYNANIDFNELVPQQKVMIPIIAKIEDEDGASIPKTDENMKS